VKNQRFENKIMVITGAAQGIGRAVAISAASEGATLVLIDRSHLIAEVKSEILALGAACHAIIADLEFYLEAEKAMREAHKAFGKIDILINNVGGTIWAKPYVEYQASEIEAEIGRSLFPTLWCCRAVLPFLIQSRSGVIINVSSIATRGINRVPYAAAKGGVNAITASLAFEYASYGIRVAGTAPGGTEAPPRKIPRNDSKLTDAEEGWYKAVVEQTKASSLMKRYGTLKEQAAPILFMASDEASFITGSTLPVGGGDQG
jgi:dihydroxycyclohexadiene carboxylate dehydrogenase